MKASPLSLVRRAQRVQLAESMGLDTYSYDFAPVHDQAREHPLSPYEGFGTITSSYDLASVGAVAEVKRALKKLADFERVPDAATDALDGGTDTWSDTAAIAFATRVSRVRSRMPWALSEPFMQTGPYPSKLQPTVNGLELLAGAVNDALGKDSGYELARYEAWRGGVFKPPSLVSRPPSDTPVTPTWDFAPSTFLPMDASSDEAAAVADLDALLQGIQTRAMSASSETERQGLTDAFLKASIDREQAAQRAVAASQSTQSAAVDCVTGGGTWEPSTQVCWFGKTGVTPSATPPKPSLAVATGEGHLAAWILLGGAGLAAYFYLRKSHT